MWKLIILSAFLSVCQAANINDIYGTYTAVMVYPNISMPICVKIALAEDPRKIQCTCSDGNNSTLVEIKMLERIAPLRVVSHPETVSGPMLAADKVDDLMLLMNVTCDCAGQEFNFRGVAKQLNENYTLTFIRNGPKSAKASNSDFLLSRNLPTAADLEADIARIDELKHKSGSVMCTREVYEEIRPKN